MVDIYSLTLAGLLVSCSSISDRIGRKKMFGLGSLVFRAVSALVLFADSSNKVIAVRALMGVSAAMIMPTTMSMIRNVFADPKERAVAISAWAIVSAIGGAGDPILGGVLLEFTSWHFALLVNMPLMGITFVAGLALLPEITVAKKGPWDLVAAGLSLGGMILVMWGVKRLAATLDATSPATLGALALGAVLMALFAVRIGARPVMAGAIAIEQETGVNELVAQGAFSFNESLMFSALVGGILLAAFALVVARLVPKGFSVTEEE